MNKPWILVKLGIVILLLMFAGKTFTADGDYWTFLGRFNNKSPYEYIVYESLSPATTLEQVNWIKRLVLRPYNEKKLTDSIGEYKTLLRDPQGNGSLIKIEPQGDFKDPDEAKTYYIKIGVRSSGKCSHDFTKGPFEILLSPVYFDDFDDHQEEAKKRNEELILNRIRYCGYQNSVLGVQFTQDSVQFTQWHRCEILDKEQQLVVKKIKAEEEENVDKD